MFEYFFVSTYFHTFTWRVKTSSGTISRMKPRTTLTGVGRLLTKSTLAEQVYEVLKEQILDGALKPGTRLNIDALSNELAVSSSPIREALARLEAERVIVSELYSGYSVAPTPSPAYLNQVLDFRILLEGACAKIGAAGRDPAVTDELKKVFSVMSKTHKLGARYHQYRKFVLADAQFHMIIVNSARNEVFTEIYSKMHAIAGMHAILLQSRLYLNPSQSATPSDNVLNEHRAILEAFQKGDGRAAEHALQEHLENGRKRVMAAVSDAREEQKRLAAEKSSPRRGRPRKNSD
jgi:DNA-binding GntR family transcriptional regulator